MLLKTIFFLSAVAVVVANAETSEIDQIQADGCQRMCNRMYDPVCVKEGGTLQQFGNQCELDVENCIRRTKLVGEKGPCPKSDDDETRNINDDKETSEEDSNESDDLTENEKPADCQIVCDKMYRPVCVQEGDILIEFGNQCQLDEHNCRFGTKLRGVSEPCPNPESESCPTICPAVHEPVCANDDGALREFGNACQLGVYNCQNKKRLTATEGPCPTKTVQ